MAINLNKNQSSLPENGNNLEKKDKIKNMDLFSGDSNGGDNTSQTTKKVVLIVLLMIAGLSIYYLVSKKKVLESSTDKAKDSLKYKLENNVQKSQMTDTSSTKMDTSFAKISSVDSLNTNSVESKTNNNKSLDNQYVKNKALRVIKGDFGNGIARKRNLGVEYQEIQNKVNELYRNGL